MKRVVLLLVIFGMCGAAFWVRGQKAEARTQVGQGIALCAASKSGDAAIAACKTLMSHDGIDDRAKGILQYHIGNAHVAQHEYQTGLSALNTAATLLPKEPHAHVARSSAYLGLGKAGLAIENARSVLANWPSLAPSLLQTNLRNIAHGYRQLNKPLKEISALDTYLEVAPTDISAWRRHTELLSKHAAHFDSRDVLFRQLSSLNQVISLAPSDWQSYATRAAVLGRLALTTLAAREMSQSLKVQLEHGDGGEALEGARHDEVMKRYLASLTTHAAARDALSVLTTEFARDPAALERRAHAHFMQGHMDAAIADLEAVQRLRPQDDGLRGMVEHYHRVRDALRGTGLLRG